MGELTHIGDIVWVELEKLKAEDRLPDKDMLALFKERELEINRRRDAWRGERE